MGYYIRNDSLFVVDGGETKDELITYVIESADTVTRLDDVPGTLDKTLYQSKSGFYFREEEEGPYGFAVVGVEKKENGQSYVVLSNDKSYLERMLKSN